MWKNYIVIIILLGIVTFVCLYNRKNKKVDNKKLNYKNNVMLIDKVYYLPKNLEQILGTHFYAKSVPGDNSCFYHSVLYNISSEYKLETIEENQKQMVRDLRNKLHSYITHEYWEKELSGFIDKNKLLHNIYDYNEWAGSTEWKVLVSFHNES